MFPWKRLTLFRLAMACAIALEPLPIYGIAVYGIDETAGFLSGSYF